MADSERARRPRPSAAARRRRALDNAQDKRESLVTFRSSRYRPSCASRRRSSTRSSRIASSASACPCSSRATSASTAALLGLDASDLLAQYHKQSSLKEIQIQPSKTIKLRDERQITVWIVAVVILAALVVALGVWWSNGGRFPVAPRSRRRHRRAPSPARARSATPLPQRTGSAPPAAAPTPESWRRADTANLSAALRRGLRRRESRVGHRPRPGPPQPPPRRDRRSRPPSADATTPRPVVPGRARRTFRARELGGDQRRARPASVLRHRQERPQREAQRRAAVRGRARQLGRCEDRARRRGLPRADERQARRLRALQRRRRLED